MTAFHVDQIAWLVANSDYSTLTVRLGLFAIVPLIILLVERELLAAAQPHRGRPARGWLTATTAPLMASAIMIVAVRFLDLLGYL